MGSGVLETAQRQHSTLSTDTGAPTGTLVSALRKWDWRCTVPPLCCFRPEQGRCHHQSGWVRVFLDEQCMDRHASPGVGHAWELAIRQNSKPNGEVAWP